jgi:hypothetical protein
MEYFSIDRLCERVTHVSNIQRAILVETIKTIGYCVILVMQKLDIVQVVHLKSAITLFETYFPND